MPADPVRTYVGLSSLISSPMSGLAQCTFCGLAAELVGAEFVPHGISVFCPNCAAVLGFGDGSTWVEAERKPRRSGRLTR